jgi:tetratricopeptide (TPR) repeat protein
MTPPAGTGELGDAFSKMLEVLRRLALGGASVDPAIQAEAARLVDAMDNARSGLDFALCVRELAAQLAVADRTRDAEVIVRSLILKREVMGSEWTPDYVAELRVLAEICRREGRIDEALDALGRAKRMLSGDRVEDDLDAAVELARTLNDLALMFQRAGKLTKASHEMRRAVQLFDVVAKADPDDRRRWHELGIAWSNQGVLLGALGKKQEATEAFLHAIDGLTAEQDPLRFAQVLHNLGVHLTEMGQPARATPLLEQSLDIRRRGLGDDDVRLPKTLLALARAYDDNDEPDRALPIAQEAFTRGQRHFAPGHPDLEQIRATLASLLSKAGKLEEAALLQRTDDYDVC